jgi:hypothetical protein
MKDNEDGKNSTQVVKRIGASPRLRVARHSGMESSKVLHAKIVTGRPRYLYRSGLQLYCKTRLQLLSA